MIEENLGPHLDILTQEYVLIQAWKKTSSYIRYHNWYSDTLALDSAAINLPHFLADLAKKLKTPERWISSPLRIVPAPKSQRWKASADKKWGPAERDSGAGKLRPLAHVALEDQIAATAIMLCLANRVETIQGDPRESVTDSASRAKVISYGNRLFCDTGGSHNELRHRWGSGKLYRAYYQDYQTFLARPEEVAKALTKTGNSIVVIVHSDLQKFYDTVRPGLLAEKLDALRKSDDDPAFYALAQRVLNWQWDKRDSREVQRYSSQTGISDFGSIALPQGLVASGFFANVVLLDFDRTLTSAIGSSIAPGIHIADVARYVDDLRIVLSIDQKKDLRDIERLVAQWLQSLLDLHAAGLKVSPEKTIAVLLDGDERPLVRQSRKMARIQSAISCVFRPLRPAFRWDSDHASGPFRPVGA